MAEEPTRPRRRVAEALEKGVEGVYDFLFRLFGTFWLVSTRRSACRRLIEDRHAPSAHYVLPFTYAAVGIFLVSLVAGVAGYKILDWIWFDQEIPETIVANLREGVSFFAIAAGSVPAFLFMLALSALLARTVERGRGRSRQGRALFITCYAIGTQALFLFLLAVAVSTAQILGDTPIAPRRLSGSIGTLIQVGLAAVTIISLAGALFVPVRFFQSSFGPRTGPRGRRILLLLLYTLISASSIWALPLIAALPGLVAAALKPSDEATLSVETNPILSADAGGPVLAVDVRIENHGLKTFGALSTDAVAIVRSGKEPLESDDADSFSLEPERIVDEAGAAVHFTSIAEEKLIWRRLIFRPSDEDVRRLARLAAGTDASCIQVRFWSGSEEVQSGCVRLPVVDQRPEKAPAQDPSTTSGPVE